MKSYAPALFLALAACSANGTFAPPGTAVSSRQQVRISAVTEKVLYSFKAGTDGSDPLSGLITDKTHALYGTTAFGGGGQCFGGCGTVFKLTPSGSTYTEKVLYSFKGASSMDGSGPGSPLVADSSGALFGTTEYGGGTASDGTVFKLTPSGSTYSETVLYRFKGGKDGTAPLAGLTMSRGGTLFGATLLGGDSSACGTNGSGANNGCGTIFELKPSGSTYKERVLYRFQSGTDGATPGSPPIIVGGVLYGTAATGGGNPKCGGAPINPGCGTIYKLTSGRRAFTFTLLYTFTGTTSDGANPFGGLVVDKTGVFYGTTQYGGTQNQGTVFSAKAAGSKFSESVLHNFGGANDGSYPLTGVALSRGNLYGTTEYGGGSRSAGIAFEVTASSGSERVLYVFNSKPSGEYPVGGILVGGRTLYGTTSYGGTASAGAGTVFSLSLGR